MPEKPDLFTDPAIEREMAVYCNDQRLYLSKFATSTQPWRTLVNTLRRSGRSCRIIIGTRVQQAPDYYAYPLVQNYQTKGVELSGIPGQCLGRICIRPNGLSATLDNEHQPRVLYISAATIDLTLIYPDGDMMRDMETSIAASVSLTLTTGALKFSF